jgi:hypothetical protein
MYSNITVFSNIKKILLIKIFIYYQDMTTQPFREMQRLWKDSM